MVNATLKQEITWGHKRMDPGIATHFSKRIFPGSIFSVFT